MQMSFAFADVWYVAVTIITLCLVPYVRYLQASLAALKDSLAEHDTQIARLVAVMEERSKVRDEDRASLASALAELRLAIDRLDRRLAATTSVERGMK
jgi:nitrate/nitrite-specific signal transduction histidine kinase